MPCMQGHALGQLPLGLPQVVNELWETKQELPKGVFCMQVSYHSSMMERSNSKAQAIEPEFKRLRDFAASKGNKGAGQVSAQAGGWPSALGVGVVVEGKSVRAFYHQAYPMN